MLFVVDSFYSVNKLVGSLSMDFISIFSNVSYNSPYIKINSSISQLN